MSEEHAAGHSPTLAEHDTPQIGIILAATAGVIVFVGLMIAGVDQMFQFVARDEIAAKVLRADNPALRALHAEEQLRLSRYQWADKAAGVVRIPLDRAVELTLRDWADRPGGGFVAPVETPAPSPAAVPVVAPPVEPAPKAPAPKVPAKKTK